MSLSRLAPKTNDTLEVILIGKRSQYPQVEPEVIPHFLLVLTSQHETPKTGHYQTRWKGVVPVLGLC